MAVDTVVFDVGNVLIEWNPKHLYRKLLPNDAAIDAFFAAIDFSGWNLEQDRGRTFAEGIAEIEETFPRYADLARAYDERWQESISGAINGTVAILEQLQADSVATYAITNFSAEKWIDTLARFAFLRGFKDVVVSAHEGLLKPEPEIYKIFLARNGLAAEQCVFIDDSKKNVDGAKAVGLAALHFTDPEKLAKDLRALGFKV